MSEAPVATRDADGLKGVNPDIDLSVSDEKLERGLRYCSKSRIKTYIQCPAKFFFKYWAEVRPPTNYYMTRGKQVHEAFEQFHEALADHIRETGQRPEFLSNLLQDPDNWKQWVEMVGAFFKFEERRWDAVYDSIIEDFGHPRTDRDSRRARQTALSRWKPKGVEVEGWLGEPPEDYDRADPDHVNRDGPPVGEIPWMGKADAILDTRSVPGVSGSGVVILDYKTGKVPDKRYREEGIYLEGEYYGMLFEHFYDIDGVAGYYPSADKLITSPYPNRERGFDIKRAALGMQEQPEFESENACLPSNFEYQEQPLCHYGHGKCFFYGACPSTWNK